MAVRTIMNIVVETTALLCASHGRRAAGLSPRQLRSHRHPTRAVGGAGQHTVRTHQRDRIYFARAAGERGHEAAASQNWPLGKLPVG